MSARDRVDLGFGDALEDFDPESWPVEPARPAPPAPLREETRRWAQTLGFRSREAVAPAAAPSEAAPAGQGAQSPRPVRRRRTGRNAQFNLKARPATIGAYAGSPKATAGVWTRRRNMRWRCWKSSTVLARGNHRGPRSGAGGVCPR